MKRAYSQKIHLLLKILILILKSISWLLRQLISEDSTFWTHVDILAHTNQHLNVIIILMKFATCLFKLIKNRNNNYLKLNKRMWR